jgi:hypothetical protein
LCERKDQQVEVTVMVSRCSLEVLRDAACKWVESNLNVGSIAEAEEAVLEVSRRLAESMMSTAVKKLDRKETYEGASIACECGGQARFVSYRTRWVRTMCGDVQVSRAYYHCKTCHSGESPWDSKQGLGGRVWSPGVKSLVAEMCARLTYSEVSKLLARVLGFGIEESSQQDIVADIGSRMRGEESHLMEECIDSHKEMAPESAPNRLYISVDAAKAHTDGSWHDIKTAVVFEGREGTDDSGKTTDSMVDARYVAAQEPSEMFGRRVYLRALLSGLCLAKMVVAMGDGAEWIWNIIATHFPGRVEILDYYHACEHIWRLASVLYGEGSERGKRWAETRCRKLKSSGPDSLLRALRRRKAKTAEQQEALRVETRYFQVHRKRMDYPNYQAMGLMIGSGPVEAACKVVVGQRLKQAGMRWTAPGADSILALRTAVLNGESHRIRELAKAA